MNLWNDPSSTQIHYYSAENKKSNAAVIVFPGGGYFLRAEHEGADYAKFFNSLGLDAFVVDYRVYPNFFPAPLLDARRAVRYVRHHAQEFNINPDKIAVIGSSAGGHLVSLLSTYRDELKGEGMDALDKINYIPNAQILCYPVISIDEDIANIGSFHNLLGDNFNALAPLVSTDRIVDAQTPQAFIWHTSDDDCVNVINSYKYAEALKRKDIPVEMHIFPRGVHGLGLALDNPHIAQWTALLKNWLKYISFLDD